MTDTEDLIKGLDAAGKTAVAHYRLEPDPRRDCSYSVMIVARISQMTLRTDSEAFLQSLAAALSEYSDSINYGRQIPLASLINPELARWFSETVMAGDSADIVEQLRAAREAAVSKHHEMTAAASEASRFADQCQSLTTDLTTTLDVLELARSARKLAEAERDAAQEMVIDLRQRLANVADDEQRHRADQEMLQLAYDQAIARNGNLTRDLQSAERIAATERQQCALATERANRVMNELGALQTEMEALQARIAATGAASDLQRDAAYDLQEAMLELQGQLQTVMEERDELKTALDGESHKDAHLLAQKQLIDDLQLTIAKLPTLEYVNQARQAFGRIISLAHEASEHLAPRS